MHIVVAVVAIVAIAGIVYMVYDAITHDTKPKTE